MLLTFENSLEVMKLRTDSNILQFVCYFSYLIDGPVFSQSFWVITREAWRNFLVSSLYVQVNNSCILLYKDGLSELYFVQVRVIKIGYGSP